MKAKIVVLMLISLFSFSLAGFAQDEKAKKSAKEEVVFDVSMTCENCKKRIEKNIAFEKGVSDMQVNLAEKTVKVVYQSNKTNHDKIQKALEKLGYEVKVHAPDADKE